MKNPSLSELRQLSARESRRWPRWLRLGAWAGALFGVWVGAGFFVLPPVVRLQLEKRLSAGLKRPVDVGRVQVNPLSLSLTIEGLSVSEPGGGGPFVVCKRFHANFEALSLVTGEWRFRTLLLDGFDAKVSVADNGQLNFADLLARADASPGRAASHGGSRPLRIGRLSVVAARVRYSDHSRTQPFQTEVGPTTVQLLDFYTGGADQAPGEFSAVTEAGETFAWKGALSLSPLSSRGEFKLGNIALRKYAPFYREFVRFDVTAGRLDVGSHYDLSLNGGKLALSLTDGQGVVQALQIAKRGGRSPVVVLHRIDLAGLSADLAKRSVSIARLAVTGGLVKARRDADGLDLIALFEPVVAEETLGLRIPRDQAVAEGSQGRTDVRVREFSIRELSLDVEDAALRQPARHSVTGITLDLRNFSLSQLATELPFGMRAGLGGGSLLSSAGAIAISPFKAELAVELSGFQISGASPYAAQFFNGQISTGVLSVLAQLRASFPTDGVRAVAANGDVTLVDFAVTAGTDGEPLAGWARLALKGFEFSTVPASFSVADVEWVEPAVHLVIDREGVSNVQAALHKEEAAPGRPTASAARKRHPGEGAGGGDALFVALDRLSFENASVEFVDRSVQPAVRMVVGQLTGLIDGLASSQLARATVDIRGKIDGTAPVVISGTINPFAKQAFADLRVSTKNVGLLPLGPYLGKYAGYELAKGALALEVKTKVAQRRIESTNVVTLDQFALGRRTNSAEATKLPVSLAVALLRDSAGRIVLELPVAGSLDDPLFKVDRVMMRAVTSFFAKVATSPFALLGSMFGAGEGEELSFQQFDAGGSALQPEQSIKLDVVAKALRERPTLRVDIEGAWSEAVDAPAVRERMLETEMRRLIWMDRAMVEPGIRLEEIQLAPEQKLGMVRRLYYKTYPKEAPRLRSSPQTMFSPPEEPAPSVAGQRGNLGAFQRREDPAPPPPLPPQREEGPEGEPSPAAPPPLSLQEMKVKLLAGMQVDRETLRNLANERAKSVRDYLVTSGQAEAEHLSVVAPVAAGPGKAAARANLRLR